MKKTVAEMESKDSLRIRHALPSDIDKMAELDRICFATPWSKQDFEKELIENKIALYFVATWDDEVIGYAGVWCIVDEGHITNVAVDPKHRKKGVGKKLINALLNDGKTMSGLRNFTLEVRVSNDAAIKLYKNFGFKEVGLRKEYYSDNKEDAAIMWLMEEI